MKRSKDFKLYGIVGYPLAHTLSPAMQEAAFNAGGLKAFYTVLELNPASFKKIFSRPGKIILDGFNVTVPYKEKILSFTRTRSPEVKAVGAANTFYRQNGKWSAANTDVYGFQTSLLRDGRLNPRGKMILVLGAGGAARAVLFALGRMGVRQITVANRTAAKAHRMIRKIKPFIKAAKIERIPLKGKEFRDVLARAELVINTTSVGMRASDPGLFNLNWIPKARATSRKLFMDLVYWPERTPFLKAAKLRGHKILSGKSMLLYQGAKAWELWTGKKAPINEMAKTLDAALKKRKSKE